MIEPKGTSVMNHHHPGFPVSCSRRVPAAAYGMISARKATPVRTARRAPATPADLSKGVLSEAAEPRAISGTRGATMRM
jgi:hypothetical protein